MENLMSEKEYFNCPNCNIVIDHPISGIGNEEACPKCGYALYSVLMMLKISGIVFGAAEHDEQLREYLRNNMPLPITFL
jgi:DNA-directed RNA polymerase subunit RPC12/RpoP